MTLKWSAKNQNYQFQSINSSLRPGVLIVGLGGSRLRMSIKYSRMHRAHCLWCVRHSDRIRNSLLNFNLEAISDHRSASVFHPAHKLIAVNWHLSINDSKMKWLIRWMIHQMDLSERFSHYVHPSLKDLLEIEPVFLLHRKHFNLADLSFELNLSTQWNFHHKQAKVKNRLYHRFGQMTAGRRLIKSKKSLPNSTRWRTEIVQPVVI